MNKINYDTVKELLDEQLRTFVAKNKDYGGSFESSLDEFGLTAALVRMGDKMNRIKSLIESGGDGEVKDESILDTLMDLANYATLTASYITNSNYGHNILLGNITSFDPSLFNDQKRGDV